ncbi:unnamed protein product [Nyctereutes procyonoides]|uniref:(raccoon dog) hypothetical protein n=1 Tax=Nyctereutes procyonoides TaxID=34880 RepID=A0A811XW62_NYCPR|nr:unnamed protein product [Nyctereutes procyonoides]
MLTLTHYALKNSTHKVLFTTEEREQIQVETWKSVLGEDRQTTQNPDLINAAFPLSRPTWDYNSAEGKERPWVHHQPLGAGLQAAARKPTNLAKVYDVRQVTSRPEAWPRSCWPQPQMTHGEDRGTSRSWLQGQGQDGGRAGSPNHLSPPNYLDNLQTILKIYEFGLRCKERPAGISTDSLGQWLWVGILRQPEILGSWCLQGTS